MGRPRWSKQELRSLDDRFGHAGVLLRGFAGNGGSSKIVEACADFGYIGLSSGRSSNNSRNQELCLSAIDKRGGVSDLAWMGRQEGDVISTCCTWQDGVTLYIAATYDRGPSVIGKIDLRGARKGIRSPATQPELDAFMLNSSRFINGVAERGQLMQIGGLLSLPEGLVVGGSVYSREQPNRRGPFIVRFDHDGNVDRGFRMYGGLPDSQSEVSEHIVGLGPLGSRWMPGTGILALMNFVEAGGSPVGLIVHLTSDGSPLSTPHWPGWFSLVTCVKGGHNEPIIVGGMIEPNLSGRTRNAVGSRARVCCLHPDLQIDSSFGYQGSWICPHPDSHVRAIETLFDDDLLLAGSVGRHPAVFRLTAHGTTDEAFGDRGALIFDQIEGIATSLATRFTVDSPQDGQLLVNVETPDDGLLVLGFRLGSPHQLNRETPSRSAMARKPTPQANPYAGMSEQELFARATVSHQANMQASNASMAAWATRMNSGVF
jgi:hypothetical protein